MNRLLNSIPMKRLVLYLMLLGVVPLALVALNYSSKQREFVSLKATIDHLQHEALQKRQKQATNTLVRSHYAHADHFYVDHSLESLSLLKRQRDALEEVIHNPAYTGGEQIENRYAFVTSDANRLRFHEGSVQSGEGMQETTEILSHPVEIDTQDLYELLNRIEGNRPRAPQLLITDFRLNKKPLSCGSEVYELSLKFLKREFLES